MSELEGAATAGAETNVGPQPPLGRGAALIVVATALSRLTGFLRVVAVAAAMGVTFLTNTYNSANTAPNLIFELVAAGVLTSVFVPTFVDYLVKGQREEGWDAANALTSVALVALTGISILVAVFAPLIMRGLLVGVEGSLRADAVDLGADFLRLFAPQIVLYGAGMIMTGALHAHRRFGMPAVAPIFNNVVVIGVYLAYAVMRSGEPPSVEGITSSQIWLLGAGTTAGVLAMTLCLVPSLRSLGWRFRWRFEPGHPAVRRGARLGAWALGYAGGYQAGLIVVLILANRIEGGVAAYQWAFTFFYLPHALFGVPIFNVLFTAMSEHISRGEAVGMVRRLNAGLKMLGFILFPIAAALVVMAQPLVDVTLRYGVMTREGSELVAGVVAAFAFGLPTYSAFLVFTRAFYASGDAKTPALVNAGTIVVTTTVGTILFFSLDRSDRIAGLALGHSIGFVVGACVLGAILARRVPELDLSAIGPSLFRSLLLTGVAAVVMVVVHGWVPGSGRSGALIDLGATAAAGATAYLGLAAATRTPELASIAGVARGLLKRGSR